jgi:hypothetical protein
VPAPDRPALPAGILEYELPDGWLVFAGKTGRRERPRERPPHGTARPLVPRARHAGGHVVLRVPADREPDRATLERAAGIAAYHSKARAGGVVPVSMAEGRHVSKPRGAKPGLVELRKETVLKVRPPSEAEVAAMRRGG